MPNPVRSGARLRRAAVLMLAALVAVPAAVAAAPPSTADADGGVPEGAVVLPDDPADADLGGAVGSLDARIDAERAEAVAAASAVTMNVRPSTASQDRRSQGRTTKEVTSTFKEEDAARGEPGQRGGRKRLWSRH